MITILLVFLSVVVLLSYKLRKKVQCDVPGPKPYPIVGNALEFLTGKINLLLIFQYFWVILFNYHFIDKDPLFVLEKFKNEFNLIYRAWLGPDLYIILVDPVDIEVSVVSFYSIIGMGFLRK